MISIILNYFLLLSPLELIVGFVDTVYSVSEAVATVTVLVEIKAGTVRDGETDMRRTEIERQLSGR